jgi:hypothetical protein
MIPTDDERLKIIILPMHIFSSETIAEIPKKGLSWAVQKVLKNCEVSE